MSLVNDVLRDLERRRGGADAVAPAVWASAPLRRRRPLLMGLLLLALTGVAGAAGIAAWWSGATQAEEAAALAAVVEPLLPVATLEQTPAVELAPALTEMAFESADGRLRWALEFSAEVVHSSRYDAEARRLTLRLPATRLAAALPPAALAEPALAALDLSREADGLRLEMEFARPARVRSMLEPGAERHRLLLEILLEPDARPAPVAKTPPADAAVAAAPAPVAAAADRQAVGQPVREIEPPAPVRSVAASDPRLTAEREYGIAVELWRQGRAGAAAERLHRVLELQDDHHPARELLVRLLLERRGPAVARQELAAALAQWPEQAGYALLKGRLLLEAGNAEAALTVLERALPAEVGDGDYHALLAATYQRLQRHAEAQRHYAELVRVHPQRGVWWLGLAVAAEGAGDGDHALLGYRRAAASEELDAPLRGYAEQRLQALSGS